MSGLIVFWGIVLIGAPIIAIIGYVFSAKNRKLETETMLKESSNVNFNTTQSVSNYIWIDEKQKKWAVPTKLPYGYEKYAVTKDTKIYNYSDVLNYELLEDGNTVTKGGISIGKAVVGGVLFGGVGAVIGGTSGKRVTKATCKSLRIKITTKDISKPTVYINLISLETGTDGIVYRTAYESSQKILSMLDIISNADTFDDSTKTSSPADEVKKLKELLDMGAITQEEFDKKKRELLNL